MKTKGILFDYNGVIVDDEHLQQEAVAKIVSQHGAELTPELYVQTCLGRSDKGAFENLQKAFPTLQNISVEELSRRKTQEYQRLIATKSILSKGIESVLERLCKEFELAVVTGSRRVEVQPVLEKENIAHFFQAVITSDDIQVGKPNPEGYLLGIEALRLPPEKIVVVEDTPPGVQAAKAAELKCIAIVHTVSRDQLAAADKIVESVEEITPDFIRNIINA